MSVERGQGPVPVAAVLDQVLKAAGLHQQVQRASAVDEWAEKVGDAIAKVARPRMVNGSVLVVEVRSSAWLKPIRLIQSLWPSSVDSPGTSLICMYAFSAMGMLLCSWPVAGGFVRAVGLTDTAICGLHTDDAIESRRLSLCIATNRGEPHHRPGGFCSPPPHSSNPPRLVRISDNPRLFSSPSRLAWPTIAVPESSRPGMYREPQCV